MKIATEKWGKLSAVRAGKGRVAVAYAENLEQLQEIVQWAKERQAVLLPVGGGTNLVGTDSELPLVCLRLEQNTVHGFSREGEIVRTGCGEMLASLLGRCADAGLGGLSPLFGIPGTLGGALAGNAGANGHSIFEYVVATEGIRLSDGTPWKWRDADGGWSYRHSPVPTDVLLTHAELRFARCTPQAEHLLQCEIATKRRRMVSPFPSLGSTFRNPDQEHPAGKLLEAAGCKGLSCGAFVVSDHHANWIVNPSREIGAAADYRHLVEMMKHMVAEQFGIQLREEVRFADDKMQ